MMEELEIKPTILDKVVGKDDNEESCRNIEVECYVRHDKQYTSNLQFRTYVFAGVTSFKAVPRCSIGDFATD